MRAGNLKKLRAQLGWSGEQLSTYLGISIGAVYQWEAARSRPRVNMLTRLYVLAQVAKKYATAGQLLGKVLETGTGNEARARALVMLDRTYAATATKPAKKAKKKAKKKAVKRGR